MARPVLIIGAGVSARERAAAVRVVHSDDGSLDLWGAPDNEPVPQRCSVGGVSLLGPVDAVADSPDAVVVAVDRLDAYTTRRDLAARLGRPLERFASAGHRTAGIGSARLVSVGSAVLASGVRLGGVCTSERASMSQAASARGKGFGSAPWSKVGMDSTATTGVPGGALFRVAAPRHPSSCAAERLKSTLPAAWGVSP